MCLCMWGEQESAEVNGNKTPFGHKNSRTLQEPSECDNCPKGGTPPNGKREGYRRVSCLPGQITNFAYCLAGTEPVSFQPSLPLWPISHFGAGLGLGSRRESFPSVYFGFGVSPLCRMNDPGVVTAIFPSNSHNLRPIHP